MDLHDLVLAKIRETYGEGGYRISMIHIEVEFHDNHEGLTVRMSSELDGEFEPHTMSFRV